MVRTTALIIAFCSISLLPSGAAKAQERGINDTIRLGALESSGHTYPYVFLPEVECVTQIPDPEERKRINQLRNNVYTVYSYALTAGDLFKTINAELEKCPDRRARKKYLKSIDKQLDRAFKDPLKNLSIEQGHVLISLINRQTGESCYTVIKELKGGLSAMMWQSVGVFFNNNLTHQYDPKGRDKDIERIAQELESSAAYKYQLYLQGEMMKKISKK